MTGRPAAWWLPRVLAVHVVLKVACYAVVARSAPVGDEIAYVDAGESIANALHDLVWSGRVDTAQLRQDVVGSGWFMPGQGTVLAPLYLVVPDAPIAVARLYVGLVTLAVGLLVLRRVRAVLGDRAALILAVLPGLLPMYVVFSFTTWGDLLAGLVLTALVVEMTAVIRSPDLPAAGRLGVRVGALAIAAVYLRSGALPAVALIGTVGLVVAVVRAREGRRAWLIATTAATAVFVAVLAPWSLLLSHVFDRPVLTITSTATVRAVSFGNTDEACYGPCDPDGDVYFAPVTFAREVHRATGRSELLVLSQMSAYARRDTSTPAMLADVLPNQVRYALDPVGYLSPLRGFAAHDVVTDLVGLPTYLMWLPMLLAFGVAVVRPMRRRDDEVVRLVVVLCGLGLLLQTFVHPGSGRYWPTLAPIAGLAVWSLLEGRRESGATAPTTPRTLRWTHVVVAVAAVLIEGCVITSAIAGGA